MSKEDLVDAAVINDPDNAPIFGRGNPVPGYDSRTYDIQGGAWIPEAETNLYAMLSPIQNLPRDVKQKIIDHMDRIIEIENLPVKEWKKDENINIAFDTLQNTMRQSLNNIQRYLEHNGIKRQTLHTFNSWFNVVDGWLKSVYGVMHNMRSFTPTKNIGEIENYWDMAKRNFLRLLPEIFSVFRPKNKMNQFKRRQVENCFDENFKLVDLSLANLRRKIEMALTGPCCKFLEHKKLWNIEERLKLLFGNEYERKFLMYIKRPPIWYTPFRLPSCMTLPYGSSRSPSRGRSRSPSHASEPDENGRVSRENSGFTEDDWEY